MKESRARRAERRAKKRAMPHSSPFLGALGFFIVIALIDTISVIVYATIPPYTSPLIIMGIMLGVIIALAFACTVIDLIRRKVAVERPVRAILAATDAIAAGDFSVRLTPVHLYRRRTEYDAIMENLNKMAQELSRTEVLHTDFISNVSHELKTPLAVIRNYAAAIGETADEKTRQQHAATLIHAAERLTALVTNVLKLNKLENQALTPAYSTFRLDEMLAQSALAFEELMEQKQIDLVCDLEELEIYSAPEYLEIVWNNLLSNAIKFSNIGGKIELSLTSKDGDAVVRIADNGCGISPEIGSRIFEKFYQADKSHAAEGNGLGLALVKRVIDLLGGEIAVESELHKGSTFTVTLRGVLA